MGTSSNSVTIYLNGFGFVCEHRGTVLKLDFGHGIFEWSEFVWGHRVTVTIYLNGFGFVCEHRGTVLKLDFGHGIFEWSEFVWGHRVTLLQFI